MKPSRLFAHWRQVRTELLATLDKFQDDELAYTPYPGAWSAGELMLHVADAEDGWFRYIVRKEMDQWPEHYTLEQYPTVSAIKDALNEVHEHTLAFLDALEEADLTRSVATPRGSRLTLEWIIWHVLEHEIHHRGELSLILGLLGREGLDV